MAKILITGAIELSAQFERKFITLGHNIIFVQNELERLPFDPSDIELVICNALFLYNDIADFKSLKYIQVTSAGLDRLPLEQIKSRGIEVNNARGVYSIPMAEWALCAILSLYKNTPQFFKNQMQRRWVKDRNLRELSSSRAVVVGMGSVGEQVAKRLWAMEVEVNGVDIIEKESRHIDKCFDINKLPEIIGDYDLIILTLPLTPNTHHIINSQIFDRAKKGAIFINISRGAIIDEDALIEALTSGKIAGAALDVFEDEPLDKNSPLWSLNNVIITPHNSFVSNKNQSRLERVIIENLKRYNDKQ